MIGDDEMPRMTGMLKAVDRRRRRDPRAHHFSRRHGASEVPVFRSLTAKRDADESAEQHYGVQPHGDFSIQL